MSGLGAIRPAAVDLPLFAHVLGAMVLMGALFTVGVASVLGRRRPEHARGLTRFGLRTLLVGVLPAYLLMRVGAHWAEAEMELSGGSDPAWIDIGYVTADAGAALIVASTVLATIGLRTLRDGDGGVRFGRIVGVFSLVLLAAYFVAVWAMTAKPI